MIMRMFQVLIFALSLAVVGCGGGGGGGTGGNSGVRANIVQSIAVTPAAISTNTNTTKQLTATATYADGATLDVTSIASWVSAAPTVVSVSNSGLVAAAGNAQTGIKVTASIGGAVGQSSISVTNSTAELVSLSIPIAPEITSGMSWSPTTWVDGIFSNGTGVHPYSGVQWSLSACNPSNAASFNTDGTIQGNASGTCTVTASTTTTGGAISTSATLTIAAPVLQFITIVPTTPTVAAGGTLQLTAMGTYNDFTQKNITALLQWSSGNTTAATVDNASSKGRVTGVAGGSAVITATPLLPGGHPPVAAATSTVTVPASAPAQTNGSLTAVTDNTLMYSSITISRQSTVYQTTAMFSTPAIAVGCAWYWSPPIGYAPERMDASCSEAMVKFDLAALSGKTVTSAKLRLQASVVGVGVVARQWRVRAVAEPWSGSTATWNSSADPLYYIYSQSTHNPPTAVGQIIEIDLTDVVQNWVANTHPNYGLNFQLVSYLLPNINEISLDQFEFYSSEDSGGRGPKLLVNYQ